MGAGSFSLENMWETHETCAPRWNVPAPLRSARGEMGRCRGEIERAATLVMLYKVGWIIYAAVVLPPCGRVLLAISGAAHYRPVRPVEAGGPAYAMAW